MSKTVLVTGGAKRIGAEISQHFALKKWNVIIHYNKSEYSAIDLSEKIISNGGVACTIKADLRNEDEIINMFRFSINKYNGLNVLVNNAGVFPERKELIETSIDFWKDILDTNLNSHFLTSREFARYVKQISISNKNNYDYKIINIASVGGLKHWKNRVSYNVSKSAAIHLTKSLAKELAPEISVNCVCPGLIKIEDDEILDVPEIRVPMRRYAGAEEVAETVYYFATCSQYITGQVLTVDGGLQLI